MRRIGTDIVPFVTYVRLTQEGSPVYVFMSGEDQCLTCLSCSLTREEDQFLARTTADMVAHLKTHREAGHTVPDVAFERLERDAVKNDLEMRSKTGG